MALVDMREMLKKANKERYAVGNFDVFNIEMLRGVARAAEQQRSPVIFAYCEVFGELTPMEVFAAMARKTAEALPVPAVLHLDHANHFDDVLQALDCGFTSIMLDASDKDLKGNIAATLQAKKECEKYGASLEAELGHVGGWEGRYESDDYDEPAYTNVEEASIFVQETEVDALAVAIGTVHGVYKAEPKLNIERLAELKDALWIPLALHGGSGLSDDELRACVKNGINKLNIFTDLTLAAMDRINQGGKIYMDQCMEIVDAVAKVAADRMAVFGSTGKA